MFELNDEVKEKVSEDGDGIMLNEFFEEEGELSIADLRKAMIYISAGVSTAPGFDIDKVNGDSPFKGYLPNGFGVESQDLEDVLENYGAKFLDENEEEIEFDEDSSLTLATPNLCLNYMMSNDIIPENSEHKDQYVSFGYIVMAREVHDTFYEVKVAKDEKSPLDPFVNKLNSYLSLLENQDARVSKKQEDFNIAKAEFDSAQAKLNAIEEEVLGGNLSDSELDVKHTEKKKAEMALKEKKPMYFAERQSLEDFSGDIRSADAAYFTNLLERLRVELSELG